MSPNNQINELTHLFKENAHDENAAQMAQYMKGHRPGKSNEDKFSKKTINY